MAARMTTLSVATTGTPIGALTVVCSPVGVVATVFDDEHLDEELERIASTLGARPREGGPARDAAREASAYFGGRRRRFATPLDLALAPDGFGRAVLEVTATIPFGELWTYGDVAGMAGRPRAARAAGSALARCPIELFVPCHRVVHAGGSLGGYGRHDERKRWLLRHEGAQV